MHSPELSTVTTTYSRVKFNQTIGRETRLCPNLFGIDRHKLTAKIFKTRLKLYQQLNDSPELVELRREIGDRLHTHIAFP